MTDVRVTLERDGTRVHVTVELTVVKSQQMSIKSEMKSSSEHLVLSDGSVCSYKAAEAAAFSGVFFGLRKIGDEAYAITVNDVFGQIDTADLTVCAIATHVGIEYATGHQEGVTAESLHGWRVAECLVEGNLVS